MGDEFRCLGGLVFRAERVRQTDPNRNHPDKPRVTQAGPLGVEEMCASPDLVVDTLDAASSALELGE